MACVPAPQLVMAGQASAFVPVALKVSAAQAPQVRSVVGFGVLVACVPAPQLVVAGQTRAFVPLTLKVSAAQAPHVRSVVASG